MASRAVVFRPINTDDVSNTPFEANTTFKISNESPGSNVIRHGIHNAQITPISASNLSADNIRNADGTFQTPIWKSIDHLYYKPDFKYESNRTFEHYNSRYTEKNLFYSCSIIGIPYVRTGENIKRTSFSIESTGSFHYDTFNLYDDKYGNLRDKLIDSSSFVPNKNLLGYWGFNDEFRHFELNHGTLGGDYTKGVETKRVYPSLKNKSSQIGTIAYKVKYDKGIKCTGVEQTERGSELITNGTFAGFSSETVTGWSLGDSSNKATWTSITNGIKSTNDSTNATTWHVRAYQNLHTVLEIGKEYEFKFEARVGPTTSMLGQVMTGNSIVKLSTNPAGNHFNATTFTEFSTTFTCTYTEGTAGNMAVYFWHNSTDAGSIMEIKNVSVKEVIYPDSGIAANFTSGSNAHIITENTEKFNFSNTEDFAISFWCRLPEHQAYSSSKVTSNPIITKRGTEKVPVRVHRNGKQFVEEQNQNITRTRFPFDISVTNNESNYPAGKLLFKRSQGIDTLETTSSTYITGSDWHHIVCQKSGSSKPWGEFSSLQIFVDGTEEVEISDKFNFDRYANTMNPSHLIFGALNINPDDSNKLTGELDEVRIYDKALDEAEVSALANNHYYSSSAYQTSVAGNVFYRTGQVVISSPLPKYHHALQNIYDVEYKSARTIYENEVLIKVPKADCNVSMNPSLRKPKSQFIQNQFTGSAWKPYVTTIGLYNDEAQLIAVAKLGRAVQKRDDVDMNFIVRWDY